MIPRDVAKDVVTIYNYVEIGESGFCLPTYKKTVLPDCVWRQDSQLHFKKTGMVDANAVAILIPYDYNYVPGASQVYLGDAAWTVGLGPELTGSYIVQGECSFVFPDYSETDISHVWSEYTKDDFVKDYVRPFEKHFRYKRPIEVVEHFIGTKSLWYLEVRCE